MIVATAAASIHMGKASNGSTVIFIECMAVLPAASLS